MMLYRLLWGFFLVGPAAANCVYNYQGCAYATSSECANRRECDWIPSCFAGNCISTCKGSYDRCSSLTTIEGCDAYTDCDWTGPAPTSPPTPRPTARPTPPPTPAPVPNTPMFSFLSSVTFQGTSAFSQPNSPETQAANWLESQDSLDPTDPAAQPRIIQLYALVTLGFASFSEAWTNNLGWLSTLDECQWFGVACNDNGQVTNLNLTDNGLTGYLPNDVFYLLTSLVEIKLTDNLISGILPQTVGSLIQLERLDLESNGLTGSIPPEMTQCLNLREVYLAGNQFTGIVPGEICEIDVFQVDCGQVLCASDQTEVLYEPRQCIEYFQSTSDVVMVLNGLNGLLSSAGIVTYETMTESHVRQSIENDLDPSSTIKGFSVSVDLESQMLHSDARRLQSGVQLDITILIRYRAPANGVQHDTSGWVRAAFDSDGDIETYAASLKQSDESFASLQGVQVLEVDGVAPAVDVSDPPMTTVVPTPVTTKNTTSPTAAPSVIASTAAPARTPTTAPSSIATTTAPSTRAPIPQTMLPTSVPSVSVNDTTEAPSTAVPTEEPTNSSAARSIAQRLVVVILASAFTIVVPTFVI